MQGDSEELCVHVLVRLFDTKYKKHLCVKSWNCVKGTFTNSF